MRPVLSPVEYFHKFITDEMLEEIGKSTNANLHITLAKVTSPAAILQVEGGHLPGQQPRGNVCWGGYKNSLGCSLPLLQGRTRLCP